MIFFNSFRFLIESVHVESINQNKIELGGFLFFFNIIIITILIIIAIKRSKKVKRVTFLVFLITFLITSNFFFFTEESITINPETNYNKKLTEGYDYIINTIEETKIIKIIIESKTNIKELEFSIKFFDNKKQLLYADSNKLYNLEYGNYKTFEYEKPTSILLNGGQYQLTHNAYKNVNLSSYIDYNELLPGFLLLGTIMGIIISIVYLILKYEDNKIIIINENENKKEKTNDTNYIFCTNCGSKNLKHANYCNSCGNKLINKEE